MRVYLAGPINGRSDTECKDWRSLATAELGATNVLDPMRNDYRGRELEPGSTQTIVEQDKTDIQTSSALLVYFDAPSVGTAMEILYAWQLGRPVFVVNAAGRPPSPWLAYHSQAIMPTLAEALQVVKDHHARLQPSTSS
jgi:nucleoside 2-deoxyribosyltransferase